MASGETESARSRAMEQLPRAYAVALRMRDEGATGEAIGSALDVPVEAVGRLLDIAEAKLGAILVNNQGL